MLDGSLIVNLKDDNMTTFQQAYRRIIYQMYVTAARQAKSRLSSLNQGNARVQPWVFVKSRQVRPVDPSTFNCQIYPISRSDL
jgi:hypothetical protein